MPHKRLLKRQELVSSLVLNSLRLIYDTLGNVRTPGDHIDILLLLAIRLGMSQGKLLTPAKVAVYLGIPRTSALRRLKAMQGLGAVTFDETGKYVSSTRPADNPELVKLTEGLEALVHRACVALSKMDT